MCFRQFSFRALVPAILTPFLLLAGAAAPSLGQPRSHAVVETGELDGDIEEGLRVFEGIPYAAPPIGDQRWRAPKPPLPWSGIRQAKDFGPACPQAPSKDVPAEDMSEDCLTLNIWSPARGAGEGLPVMVWIHGGGFNKGSARMPIYNGENLAKKGVVVGHPQLSPRLFWLLWPSPSDGGGESGECANSQFRPARSDRRLAMGPAQYRSFRWRSFERHAFRRIGGRNLHARAHDGPDGARPFSKGDRSKRRRPMDRAHANLPGRKVPPRGGVW